MDKKQFVIWVLLALFFFINQVWADLYKWKDENGVVHFSDTPPASEQPVKTIKTPIYPSQSIESASGKEISKKMPLINSVEIYTTSWCKYCKKAIAFLQSHRIHFRQYDIEKEKQAASRMHRLGGTGGVPFAIINGQKVQGFSEKTYRRVLGLN